MVKIPVVPQEKPCRLFLFFQQFTINRKLVRNDVSELERALPPARDSPVSCYRQRGSLRCTEPPEAKTLSEGDPPPSRHKSQQWNHCWGSHLWHTTNDSMSLPLTFKRGRWHLEISEGETVTVQPLQELFNPCASETEQSIQGEEGHDCSLTRFPSQSPASQSTFPSASY